MPDAVPPLHAYRRSAADLTAALRTFAAATADPPAAIVYTPARCLFATVSADGQLHGAVGPVAGAYEVRAFTPVAELRWRSDPRGTRTAVVLSDTPLTLDGWKSGPVPVVTGTIPQTYLLWGEGTGQAQAGWSQMATARIGAYSVPLPNVAERTRVVLSAVEYLARDPKHGNTYVFEERLVSLTPEENTRG